ncbi:MAG: hypothetical protein IKG18_01835 [Atopobiaceae bacterium]|nr:hypothetical protein [Atopobiaceae bacterium]
MSISEHALWELNHLPCLPYRKRGLDGSTIIRRGWRVFLINDGGAIRQVGRLEAQHWAEANLCPRDFVHLLWLHPSELVSYSIITGPGIHRALRFLARTNKTDVSRLVARIVDDWVENVEPDNWWSERKDEWGRSIKWADAEAKIVPPIATDIYKPARRWEHIEFMTTGRTLETCRRMYGTHSYGPGDIVDYVVDEWCRRIGRPVDRGKGMLRLV